MHPTPAHIAALHTASNLRFEVMTKGQAKVFFDKKINSYQDERDKWQRRVKRNPSIPEPQEFPGIQYLHFKDFYETWHESDWHKGTRFLFAFDEDGEVAGVMMYGDRDSDIQDLNHTRSYYGHPPIEGRVYVSHFISVRSDLKKTGVGTQLKNQFLARMSPGDIYRITDRGSYSEEGHPFNVRWLSSQGSKINIIFDTQGYSDYDPDKPNFLMFVKRIDLRST